MAQSYRVLPDRLDARSPHRLGPCAPLRPEPGRQVVGQALRDAAYADDSLLPHLLPLGWEYINLTAEPASQIVRLPPLTAAQSTLAYDFPVS